MQEESPGWGEGGHPSNVFLRVQRDGGEGKEPDHCPLVTLHTGQVQGRASIPDPFDVITMNPPPGWGDLQLLILNIFGINITPVQYNTNV